MEASNRRSEDNPIITPPPGKLRPAEPPDKDTSRFKRNTRFEMCSDLCRLINHRFTLQTNLWRST